MQLVQRSKFQEAPRYQIDMKRCGLYPFLNKVFTVAAKLKVLGCNASKVGARV